MLFPILLDLIESEQALGQFKVYITHTQWCIAKIL